MACPPVVQLPPLDRAPEAADHRAVQRCFDDHLPLRLDAAPPSTGGGGPGRIAPQRGARSARGEPFLRFCGPGGGCLGPGMTNRNSYTINRPAMSTAAMIARFSFSLAVVLLDQVLRAVGVGRIRQRARGDTERSVGCSARRAANPWVSRTWREYSEQLGSKRHTGGSSGLNPT